jgi:hypothetical protein
MKKEIIKLFPVLIFFLILSPPLIYSASECDNYKTKHPEWLVCEDFEGFNGTEGNNSDFISWLNQSPWLKEKASIDPSLITITKNEFFQGNKSLYMPAAASGGYNGSSLNWYDCSGNKELGCSLTGHEQLYLRTYVKFAPDHQYVHHFMNVGGSQPDGFWNAMGLANCRPNGFISASTTVDFDGITRKSFFYTYSIDMYCCTPDQCGGVSRAQEICNGCAARGLPCPKDVLECCWGNSYPQTQTNDSLLPRDQWICIEMMINLNDPGIKNGTMAYWINDKLIHQENTMYWRIDSNLQLNRVGLQHYIESSEAKGHSNKVWWDNAVISTERIGCGNYTIQPPTINVTTMQKLLNSFVSFKSNGLNLTQYIDKIKDWINN